MIFLSRPFLVIASGLRDAREKKYGDKKITDLTDYTDHPNGYETPRPGPGGPPAPERRRPTSGPRLDARRDNPPIYLKFYGFYGSEPSIEHELAEAVAGRPRLMPVFLQNPNTGADHPALQRFDAEIQAIKP